MRQSLRKHVVVGCAVFLSSWAPASVGHANQTNNARPKLTVKVRVYNYANVPPATLTEAEQVASSIFHPHGVPLEWFDCARNPAVVPQYPACEQAGGGPMALALKILPRSMARRYSMPMDIFGFALPASKDGYAAYANVFFHRAEELAERKEAVGGKHYPSLAVILGHVVAHELGHLFMGWRHRPTGIMTAQWKKRQLSEMAQGKFGFTRREGELLRAGTVERARAALR